MTRFNPLPHCLKKISHRFRQDTITIIWIITYSTRNHNDIIAIAKLYRLNYTLKPSRVCMKKLDARTINFPSIDVTF